MKYKITIDDLHIIDGEKENSTVSVSGNVMFLTDGFKIHYKETGEGYEGCFVTLDVSENKVVMKRTGALNSEMVIEKNIRHLSEYATPAGIMDLGVTGDEVYFDVTPEGGKLNFSYIIDVNGNPISENKLSVKLKRG